MRASNGQNPLVEGLRATGHVKRKHSLILEQSSHRHGKRQKLESRLETTETLTVKSNLSRNASTSNRFESIRCSRREHKEYKRRKLTNSEGCREWVYSRRNLSDYIDKVVVVSYNILGIENAAKHPDLYYKVPSKFMDWERRKTIICKEVNNYNANVLCFQEVDRFNDLDDLLQKDGFRGIYKARTGEACDGCALFWKENLFTLLHQENIEFQSFGLRDNVAQLCVLKMNGRSSYNEMSMTAPSQDRKLVVGNIHVLFNPKRGDIKLGQVRLFLEKAYNLCQEWGNIPVILAGDLNSIPQSAIYQFLASSELNIQLHDRRTMSGQIENLPQHQAFRCQNEHGASRWMSISRPLSYRWTDEELRLATGSVGITHLWHRLKLFSAYHGVPGCGKTRDNNGEPLATSYHSKFMGTVDYIWHTKELVPVKVLETLPPHALRRTGGLPSEKCGSDHLALACELAFTDNDNVT